MRVLRFIVAWPFLVVLFLWLLICIGILGKDNSRGLFKRYLEHLAEEVDNSFTKL